MRGVSKWCTVRKFFGPLDEGVHSRSVGIDCTGWKLCETDHRINNGPHSCSHCEISHFFKWKVKISWTFIFIFSFFFSSHFPNYPCLLSYRMTFSSVVRRGIWFLRIWQRNTKKWSTETRSWRRQGKSSRSWQRPLCTGRQSRARRW